MRLDYPEYNGGGGGEEKCDSLIARVFHGSNAGKFLRVIVPADLTLRSDDCERAFSNFALSPSTLAFAVRARACLKFLY